MNRFRTFLLGLTAALMSLSLCLLALEIVFRFLPVATGMNVQPVTHEQPVAKFVASQDFIWSDEWNFVIQNRGRINNDGFVNDQNYDPGDPRPLLAVIGDSYIEAVMVPYAKTMHGILAAKLAPDARVYSFAASGAPLSQYLIWAQYAKEHYKPDAIAFLIVGNDFDESLPRYASHQTFHQFTDDGKPELLNEYRPSWKRALVGSSALARYVFFNLNAWAAWHNIRQKFLCADKQQDDFVGNTVASLDEQRLMDSKRAVDNFFRLLSGYSGLAPRDILFVVDSSRGWIYEGKSAPDENYFDTMRVYLIKTATARGYGVVDMDMPFQKDFAAYGKRFEFPTDGHWNEHAHALAADAISITKIFKDLNRERP